jgi:hypothetical protein
MISCWKANLEVAQDHAYFSGESTIYGFFGLLHGMFCYFWFGASSAIV